MDTDSEEQIAVLLNRAADVEPRYDFLLSGVARRGRALRRRRRLTLGTSVAALVAATGAVAYLAAPSPQPGASLPAAGPRPTSTTASPTPTRSTPPPARPSAVAAPEGQLTRQLITMLPAGSRVTDARTTSGDAGRSFVLTDSKGKTRITVGLDSKMAAVRKCLPGDNQNADPTTSAQACTDLGNGYIVLSLRSRIFDKHGVEPGVWNLTASLSRPDGIGLLVSEENSLKEIGAPASRHGLPFSLDQLTAMLMKLRAPK